MGHLAFMFSAILAVVLFAARFQKANASYIAPNWHVPGISANQMPQFILLTHDDNTDDIALKAVTEITRAHVNPNGCTIPATFFSTGTLSNCKTVKALHNIGHEIAGHTMTHHDLVKMPDAEKKKEIFGVMQFIKSCGIPANEIRGHRSPYLSDNVAVRDIIQQAGFEFDSSIPEVYPSPTSPSAGKRLFPYSFNNGNPQVYSCKWFNDINHCTTSEKHNLMEIPMWLYQKGPNTASTNNLMDPTTPFQTLKAEFDRNYKAHRAPVGIWTHTSTGYLTQKSNRDGISQFMTYALAHPDVWVVTSSQLLDYMQHPVPVSQMTSFMANYTCSKTGIP